MLEGNVGKDRLGLCDERAFCRGLTQVSRLYNHAFSALLFYNEFVGGRCRKGQNHATIGEVVGYIV